MTEVRHATDALLALAEPTPSPGVQADATAQSSPVPTATPRRRRGVHCIEGRATTRTERRRARHAHHAYGHRRPAPSHSRLPSGELPTPSAPSRPAGAGAQRGSQPGEPPVVGGSRARSPRL